MKKNKVITNNSTTPQDYWIKTELYFGITIPSGGKVIDTQWKNFVESYITPAFPQGFTTIKTTARWLDSKTNKVLTEPSRMITIFYKKDEAIEKDGLIENIYNQYIQSFQQPSVLRTDEIVKVQFY